MFLKMLVMLRQGLWISSVCHVSIDHHQKLLKVFLEQLFSSVPFARVDFARFFADEASKGIGARRPARVRVLPPSKQT